jgi:XTP/dITP diphosphohydrolase
MWVHTKLILTNAYIKYWPVRNTICIATNNKHKLKEMSHMLGSFFSLVTLQDIGCTVELPETQCTIEGNSLQKAEYVFQQYNIPCIADDTGLEVTALNGEPGVYSARYAGEQKNSDDNIDLLLKNLQSVKDRNARFKAVITFIDTNHEISTFEGIVEGEILESRQGSGGFGYDPVFKPLGYEKTLAEMSLDEKNTISHRGRAVKKLVTFFKEKYG